MLYFLMLKYSFFNAELHFFSDDMGLHNVVLNNVILDDLNFDDDDAKTFIHVKIMAFCNRYK